MHKGRCRLAVALVAVAVMLVLSAQAGAATTLFWSNDNSGGPISSVGLGDGSTITNRSTGANDPVGIALDLAHGRIYYAYRTGIDYMNLDGSGDTAFNTTGATIDNASSLAIDPAVGKLFWTNWNGSRISWASLDGSGGGDLPITGAAVDDPHGLVVDPSAGKLYWTNSDVNTIASANVDGSNATVLPIAAADLNDPIDLAVDTAAGKLYWANCGANTIGAANLDGSGGGTLPTAPVTPNCPNSIAIDHAAGRLYWSNYDASPGSISYAQLDGSGGGNAVASTANSPERLALVGAPVAPGAPSVTGGATTGSTLTCSTQWSPGPLEAHLYQAPTTLSYSWTFNGTAIAGATASSITAGSAGQYGCAVNGTNLAGTATTPSSAPYTVQASVSPTPTTPTTPTPVAVPANTSRPQIKGHAKAGQTVTCAPGTWSASPTGYAYAWSEDGTPIQGASRATYRVAAADEGLALRCTVTAANHVGTSSPASSAATQVPVPKVAGCPAATGTIAAGHLGQAELGMTRPQVRSAYRGDRRTTRGGEDSFCLTPSGVSVGYGTSGLLKTLPARVGAALSRRVIWIVTANRRYAIDGIRVGATVAAASHVLHPGFGVRIGTATWYLVARKGSAFVLRTSRGVVQEIGVTDSRLTHSRAVELRLLHSFT